MNTDQIARHDKLEVVNADSHASIKNGEVYTVDRVDDRYVYLVGQAYHAGFYPWRFKKITTKPMQTQSTQPRLPNGRFSSTVATLNPNTVLSRQTVTQQGALNTPKSNVPKTLRNGSIYRVAGGPVARLVGVVKKFATLTVHGKPIAVPIERVRLADKDDVTAYLADSEANKAVA